MTALLVLSKHDGAIHLPLSTPLSTPSSPGPLTTIVMALPVLLKHDGAVHLALRTLLSTLRSPGPIMMMMMALLVPLKHDGAVLLPLVVLLAPRMLPGPAMMMMMMKRLLWQSNMDAVMLPSQLLDQKSQSELLKLKYLFCCMILTFVYSFNLVLKTD
jgi:hypothetical protein